MEVGGGRCGGKPLARGAEVHGWCAGQLAASWMFKILVVACQASRARPWEQCGTMSRVQPSLGTGRELYCSLADESSRSCSFASRGHL